jgi:nucleotide-binding universal stress UspA family protein
MYRKVMVPLDGSHTAECVLPHMRAVVSGCGVADVVLLRVIRPLPDRGYAPAYTHISERDRAQRDAEHWAEVEGYLEEVAKRLADEGLSVETDAVEGYVTESIIDYADKHGVDLIVMATHGRTGAGRFMMGSVAEKVVRHSNVPVLLVRATKDACAS